MQPTQQSLRFRREKQQFFSQLNTFDTISDKFSAADTRATEVDYHFLLKNQYLLEREFSELFHALQKQSDKNKEPFWYYCYYCASLLQEFYKAYGQQAKADNMAKIKEQIKNHLNNDRVHQYSDQSFNDYLYTSFKDSFSNLIHAPFHVAKIRDYVGYANICRIYWVFSRLTMVQGFNLARGLIEQLDILLGSHTDVDKIISNLQVPTAFINYFSVGFFLARIAIDGGLLIKHTFFPSQAERDKQRGCELHRLKILPGPVSIEAYRNSYVLVGKELFYIPKSGAEITLNVSDINALSDKVVDISSVYLSAQDINDLITAATGHTPEKTTAFERFQNELKKRHCNFINDFIWATVNFLTNFNHLTGISGPVASYITVLFLVFDLSMILYRSHLAKQEYLVKNSQYHAEIQSYNSADFAPHFSEQEKQAHNQLLSLQLQELEINWRTKEANFYFLAGATAMLILGFTASMIISSPLMIVGCYFACSIAVAMYLSSDAYTVYKEKELYLERAEPEQLPLLRKEYELARNDFIVTLTKHAVMPTLLITTFAVCWPAAVLLAAAYVGFELLYAKGQHAEKQEINKLLAAETETGASLI